MPRQAKKLRGIYQHPKRAGEWWIQYFVDGRRRREKAGTRQNAIDLLDKRRGERLRGEKLPELGRRKGVTVHDLLMLADAHVGAEYRTQRSGRDSQDYRFSALDAKFGGFRADRLTPASIKIGLAELAAERDWKPASINRHKAFLSLAYRLGNESEKVSCNPARLVPRKREGDGRVRWLNASEETRLMHVLRTDYPDQIPAFLLSLHTGMRLSEQYRLCWDCVDVEHRQITVRDSKHGGVRYVPLDDTAIDCLSQLRERAEGTGPVMRAARGGHGKQVGEALKTPKQWFGAAVRKAGLDDYTWHCNRHTTASRLVQAGVPLKTVQEIMGHKTIAITMRYAHLAPGMTHDAICRLDAWGKVEAEQTATTTATSDTIGGSRSRQKRSEVPVLQ